MATTDEGGFGGTIADVPGVAVGHWTDLEAATGCTAVLCGDDGAVGGVAVRGGSPGTRETDLLNPVCRVERVHAVILSGGSAFGLAAAGGVQQWLEERGIGFATPHGPVPIVPAAILYDLGIGSSGVRPDAAAGYAACDAAVLNRVAAPAVAGPLETGSVGAGAGATVAKGFGVDGAVKGGFGTARCRLSPGDISVAAAVAINAWGGVYDHRDGSLIAGPRRPDGRMADPVAVAMGLSDSGRRPAVGSGLRRNDGKYGGTSAAVGSGLRRNDGEYRGTSAAVGSGLRRNDGEYGGTSAAVGSGLRRNDGDVVNTTIGVIATDAGLDKMQANFVASSAHDGLALTIRPCHLPSDGDTLFCVATGVNPAPVNLMALVAAATEVTARAVINAIRSATGLAGVPAVGELGVRR